ncbi:MAG TPA: DNA polymerase III subunit gamma and tau, partial [Leifsonia sp.]|nr:DNA polymerase III subunit gamma and tau [Leifsonia sp.]
QVKDAWPQILDAVQKAKRSAWMVVFTAQVRSLEGDVLTLSFPSDNDVASFRQQQAGGALGVSEYLRQAIVDILGIRVKYIARAEGSSSGPAGPSGPTSAPAAPSAPSGAGAPPAEPASAAVRAATTEWAVVAIPGSGAPTPARASVGTLEREPEPLDDSAPPEEIEPPEEPPLPEEPLGEWAAEPTAAGSPPARPAASAAPAAGARTPTFQEPQRYGEAVVREILGATFIEEQAAPSAGSGAR